MAEAENQDKPKVTTKSLHAEREERILAYWKEKGIFEKSLEKRSPKGEFIFYEGPPTANGHPGIHHLEARAFKDAIPRYKTMQGFHVRRKGGWDTHGLPVELQVEKELGLKVKKDIEEYGIGKFNDRCKESVWKYVHEWEDFTARMGYWVDLKDPYITYKPDYIESIWNIVKTVEEKKLLYKDYKVVPWCPRCGTGLSSHELAQGYQDVKDLSLTIKFKVKNPETIGIKGDVYLLAWTTTPWTLPGNVALAVNLDMSYRAYQIHGEYHIAAVDRAKHLNLEDPNMGYQFTGRNLVDLEYEPLFPYLKESISETERPRLKNAFKVYAADFVTTEDGTGIVHTAVMYGQEDFELGTAVGLPKVHLVNEDGTFKQNMGYLSSRFVKEKDDKGKPTLDVDIIEDLKKRNLFFSQEWYKHTYPHCWRCKTPLIYYARDSWYIKMSALRNDLVKGNKSINWEPEYIKDGRFGEWLSEIKDWAISRERYWGTPLPIWLCEKCNKRKVVGSVEEISKKPKNKYWVMRHGEAENNVRDILNSDMSKSFHLTELGKTKVKESAEGLKHKIDLVFSSPILRTKETAEIFSDVIGYDKGQIIYDDRLREMGMGDFEGSTEADLSGLYENRRDYFTGNKKGVENRYDQKRRMGRFLEETESKYQGKNILIISHAGPLWMMSAAAQGHDIDQSLVAKPKGEVYLEKAEIKPLEYKILPRNSEYELDLHRPNIDQVTLDCECGGKMKRIKEVMDVWFDSGAMPFAQDHYPFENKEYIDKVGFPADFISEAIDQTRGWFYTLHAIGTLMGKGPAYKNVICLGHILDPEGKKMSKSIGNIVNPFDIMEKYGADAARFWMYSINQPGESKNFDEKTVDEIVKKVFNLVSNVLSFYKLYAGENKARPLPIPASKNILDKWIISLLNELNKEVTTKLDEYKFLEPTRAIRDFIADLSQWYLRRSRDRFKENGKDKNEALSTTRYVLITLAKIMAPFAPFFAEELYREAGGELDSVHLEDWPVSGKVDSELIESMKVVRELSSKGLEARMMAKINVRQPLISLNTTTAVLTLNQHLIDLIKDEVNVKEVSFDSDIKTEVELDTTMTPELIEEGQVRELLRKIQDMRKEKGLSVGDSANLMATTDLKELISKNEKLIKKTTGLVEIKFGDEFKLY